MHIYANASTYLHGHALYNANVYTYRFGKIAWQAVFALLSPNSLNSACAMGITQARRLNFAYLFCSVGLSVGRQVDAL